MTQLQFNCLRALVAFGALFATPILHPLQVAAPGSQPVSVREWRAFGGTDAGTRYVPIDQITPANVAGLEVAWTYRTGLPGNIQATPLQVGDTLYLCVQRNVVVALNAETGAERWRFDPQLDFKRTPRNVYGASYSCRGVAYYRLPAAGNATQGAQPRECEERILTNTTEARLIALDARSGIPCAHFGNNGQVDLFEGMGYVGPAQYYPTSAPTIARNVAVLGGWVFDNQNVKEPSGVVRAYDAATGALAWAWDMGRPGVHSAPAPGETYTRGTPNAWAPYSYDDELGLLYLPTGIATPDFVGGHRTELMEKYAASVVALDVVTGDVRWSFQTSHHDLWDYDVASQPTLVDIPSAGGDLVKALIQPTKRGEIFLLDRRDGHSLAAVEERPVPQTDVPGEWTSKTQPFSVGMPSFGDRVLREADMWGITPFDQLWCRLQFRKLRYEGPMTPPSLGGSLLSPSYYGAINWGSVSVDEERLIMVVNSNAASNILQLVPREVADRAPGNRQEGTPYGASGNKPFMSPLAIPCERPPYGKLTAVDLRTHRVIWSRALGTANELGPLGWRLRMPLPIGVPSTGGSLITRPGLIFIGGTRDRYFRVFELTSGRELWRHYLPAAASATPMSYISPASGRQFVVLAVGGEFQRVPGGRGQPAPSPGPGGYVLGFAVPKISLLPTTE